MHFIVETGKILNKIGSKHFQAQQANNERGKRESVNKLFDAMKSYHNTKKIPIADKMTKPYNVATPQPTS